MVCLFFNCTVSDHDLRNNVNIHTDHEQSRRGGRANSHKHKRLIGLVYALWEMWESLTFVRAYLDSRSAKLLLAD